MSSMRDSSDLGGSPPPKGGSRTWALRLKALCLIVTARVWRGGPRMLLQLAAVVVCFLMVVSMFPDHLGGARYRNIIPWSKPSPKGEDGGNLRIVVFGSQDLVGSAADANGRRTTWTDQLCRELNCSSSVSFVPAAHVSPGLTSNTIYNTQLQGLQQTARESNITFSPADDYFFVAEQYPVPTRTPDLEEQVTEFLSRPPPRTAPRETLWVFTFGTWDVWNLAAMPIKKGESAVDELISHIFSQIEYLYEKSLDSTSIAFSDFGSGETSGQPATAAAPESAEEVDKRKFESFRVLIPQLFDMSLTPGWHKRPSPSIPHTKAGQMRNAAVLTKRWNKKVAQEMDLWQKKERSGPGDVEEENVAVADARRRDPDESVPDESVPDAEYLSQGQEKDAVEAEVAAHEPYPLRLGLQSDPVAGTLSAMTEEEMQRSGLRDGKGRGDVPADDPMRFLDVWTACVADGGAECDAPDDHLFYDAFTLGQRAMEGLTRQTAAEVTDSLLLRREPPAEVDRRRRVSFTA